MIVIRRAAAVCLLLCTVYTGKAQFLMDMIDTTKDVGKGMLQIYRKFDRLNMSGYLQPQFQVAQEKGAKSYNGGDFGTHVNNRFMIRRGRVRFDLLYVISGDASLKINGSFSLLRPACLRGHLAMN
jgi:hypothetical protein